MKFDSNLPEANELLLKLPWRLITKHYSMYLECVWKWHIFRYSKTSQVPMSWLSVATVDWLWVSHTSSYNLQGHTYQIISVWYKTKVVSQNLATNSGEFCAWVTQIHETHWQSYLKNNLSLPWKLIFSKSYSTTVGSPPNFPKLTTQL